MISVIHNTYDFNEFIRESVLLNIRALEDAGLDYQYIIFNDKGNPAIEAEIHDLISDKVQYIYSDINFGMGVCSGGWIGALPYVKGEYIHNTGQDDVFTSQFYESMVRELSRDSIHLAYANGFVVNSNLTLQNGATMGPTHPLNYTNTKEVFNSWFQRAGKTLNAANNYIPAPGVVYKKLLHELIGPPDLNTFKGSADFEYWARVLYYGMGVSYTPQPLWLYRMSEYSAGSKPSADTNSWNALIKEKYQKLVNNE